MAIEKKIDKKTDEKKLTHFQFAKELDYPLYIECELSTFDPSILSFFTSNRFEVITGDDVKKMKTRLLENKGARLIVIEPASTTVIRQIESLFDGDRFGAESITPKDGYRVYRYKSFALMVSSFTSSTWKMGVTSKFGTKSSLAESATILHRATSLALSVLGVIGIWGHLVDEGLVAMKVKEAEGSAVYIDLAKGKFITGAKIKPLPASFSIIRLDHTLKGRSLQMKREELLSYISVCVTFFDYQGLTVPLRQLLQKVSSVALGQVYPKENFRPKTDLSL